MIKGKHPRPELLLWRKAPFRLAPGTGDVRLKSFLRLPGSMEESCRDGVWACGWEAGAQWMHKRPSNMIESKQSEIAEAQELPWVPCGFLLSCHPLSSAGAVALEDYTLTLKPRNRNRDLVSEKV